MTCANRCQSSLAGEFEYVAQAAKEAGILNAKKRHDGK